MALAIMAFHQYQGGGRLGQLARISGGQFTGDGETYVSTQAVLAKMGAWQEAVA
jgi:hypothetical protein